MPYLSANILAWAYGECIEFSIIGTKQEVEDASRHLFLIYPEDEYGTKVILDGSITWKKNTSKWKRVVSIFNKPGKLINQQEEKSSE